MCNNKDTSQIPDGLYCYTVLNIADTNDHLNIKPCPYWSCAKDQQDQNNGYCSYMQVGDWEHPGLGLLWDMIKECGIRDDIIEDEE